MQTARTRDTYQHVDELAYIQTINPLEPGATFNHSPECFARYCHMQARQMLRAKHYLTVTDVLQSRDTALLFALPAGARLQWIYDQSLGTGDIMVQRAERERRGICHLHHDIPATS